MAIQVTCDSCFYAFQVKDEHAGKKGKCPECGEAVPIPARGSRSSGSRPAPSTRSSSPRRSSPKEESGSNQGTLIAAGIAGGIVVVGLVFFLFLRSGSRPPANQTNQPIATNNASAPPVANSGAGFPSPNTRGPNATNPPGVSTAPTSSVPQPPAGLTTSGPSTAPAAPPVSQPGAASPQGNARTAGRKEYSSVADLIEAVMPSACRVNVKLAEGTSTGSGFVVDREGVIVTNYHVIEGSESAQIIFPDGTGADVKGILALDPKRDLAVLKIDYPAEALKPVTLATSEPRPGEVVVAIGAPLGLSFTSTKGDVSSNRKAEELRQYGADVEGTWIQTTAPISPGNSGGPLFNMYGEVVAANTMTIAAQGAQNLNFGTTAENIRKVVASKSSTLIAMSPKAAPPREGKARSGGNPNVEIDETKTLRGKQLLREIKQIVMLDADISRQISNPRIQDYVTEQASRMWKKSGVEIIRRVPAPALMAVVMRLKPSGTSSSANVIEIQTFVVVRDKEGRLCRVWDSTEDCGAMSQIALTKGDIPQRTGKKIQDFFARIPAAMEEAKKEAEKESGDGKKEEGKKDDDKKGDPKKTSAK